MGRKLYIDMDGTLCEFNPVIQIEDLYQKGYFLGLRPHDQMVEAVRSLVKQNEISKTFDEIVVFSSVLQDSKYAEEEKRDWLKKYFGNEYNNLGEKFIPCGMNKAEKLIHDRTMFTQNESEDVSLSKLHETDILIDDYSKNLHDWSKAGGHAIKLMNGINGNRGTWDGDRINCNMDFFLLVDEIIRLSQRGIPDLSEIYTMEQWVRDGEFMAKPGQRITEEVYETMYNKLPPLDLPTGKAEYSLQCLNVPVHEGFLMGGSVGSGEKNEKLYYAFAKNNYGKGDKFYYIGLSPKAKILTGDYYFFDCMNADVNKFFKASEFKDDMDAIMFGANYEADVYRCHFNHNGEKTENKCIYSIYDGIKKEQEEVKETVEKKKDKTR